MPRGEDQVLELGGRLTGRGSECVVPREWRAHCRAPLVQSGFCLQIAASGRRLRIRVRRFDSCRGHAAETRQGERDVPRPHAATGIRPLDTADPTEAVAAPWPDVLRRSHPGRRLRRADGLGEHSESCRDEVSLNRGICLAVTGAPRRVDGREESPELAELLLAADDLRRHQPTLQPGAGNLKSWPCRFAGSFFQLPVRGCDGARSPAVERTP
jgi:hypothetical protein